MCDKLPDLSWPSRIAASATALAIAARMEPAFSSKRRPSCSKFSFGSLFFALVLLPPLPVGMTVGGAMAPGGRSACHSEVRISCDAMVNRRKLNSLVANSL